MARARINRLGCERGAAGWGKSFIGARLHLFARKSGGTRFGSFPTGVLLALDSRKEGEGEKKTLPCGPG